MSLGAASMLLVSVPAVHWQAHLHREMTLRSTLPLTRHIPEPCARPAQLTGAQGEGRKGGEGEGWRGRRRSGGQRSYPFILLISSSSKSPIQENSPLTGQHASLIETQKCSVSVISVSSSIHHLLKWQTGPIFKSQGTFRAFKTHCGHAWDLKSSLLKILFMGYET